jgi:DNA-binding MarR family transcriptional regulator
LVIYKDNPSDQRTQLLELTSSGENVLAAMYRRNEEWSGRVMTKLDPKRLAGVTDELEGIGRILEDVS